VLVVTELFNSKVTIYNDIPSDGVNQRSFRRFVVERCSIQGGYVEKADGTIQNIVNAKTVITKDTKRYKSPNEYAFLPDDEKNKFFTAQIDDFVVLSEVDDVITTSREFQELQDKYKNNGMSLTSVNVNINGMVTDNVTMANA
jgi:hypothetical protein